MCFLDKFVYRRTKVNALAKKPIFTQLFLYIMRIRMLPQWGLLWTQRNIYDIRFSLPSTQPKAIIFRLAFRHRFCMIARNVNKICLLKCDRCIPFYALISTNLNLFIFTIVVLANQRVRFRFVLNCYSKYNIQNGGYRFKPMRNVVYIWLTSFQSINLSSPFWGFLKF